MTEQLSTKMPETKWSMTPNLYFELMPKMKEAEMKVMGAAIRNIYGYRKTAPEPMSQSWFMKQTGLSRNGVKKGIEAATTRGWLQLATEPTRKTASEYVLVSEDSKVSKSDNNIDKGGSQFDPQNLTPHKESSTGKKKNSIAADKPPLGMPPNNPPAPPTPPVTEPALLPSEKNATPDDGHGVPPPSAEADKLKVNNALAKEYRDVLYDCRPAQHAKFKVTGDKHWWSVAWALARDGRIAVNEIPALWDHIVKLSETWPNFTVAIVEKYYADYIDKRQPKQQPQTKVIYVPLPDSTE